MQIWEMHPPMRSPFPPSVKIRLNPWYPRFILPAS